MSKVNLTAYTISIKEKFSRQQSENIDNIIGSGITLKQVIESAISRYSINNGNGVPFRDTTSQKALLFSSSQNSVYPTNTPRLDLKKVQLYHGEYGLVQDVLDTQTGVLQQGLIDEN